MAMASSSSSSSSSSPPPPPPPPQPPILRLPLEVLLRIAGSLTTPELCSLRLTCRSVEELLYVTFTGEFFTKKQFMVTDFSLQALVAISKSRLGRHLRQLHIGLDRFPEGIQRPLPDEERERRFKQRYADCFTLWNTGAHRAMLAEALRSLPRLDEVVLRDFNAPRRLRDGPGAEWTSYGSTTIFEETGVRLGLGGGGIGGGFVGAAWDSSLSLHGCSQVFALLLHALADAAVSPSGIRVMARRANQLRDFAFNLPPFVEPSLAPVLAGLEKLHLSIDLSWRSSLSGWAVHGGPAPCRSQSDTRLLRRFLAHTPNLRDLRINEHHDFNPALSDFLEWLARPAPPTPDAGDAADADADADADTTPPLALARLEDLSLGMLNVAPRTLLHVVRKFAPRLRGLELWKITLQRPLPEGSDPSDPPRANFWLDLMVQLRQLPDLDLHHFKAGMLKQTYSHRPRSYQVCFGQRGPDICYTGPCCNDFLDEVTPLLDVKWPRTVTPDRDGSSDEDSDGSESGLFVPELNE